MTRKTHTFADAGAFALAASILFAGILSAGSAQAATVDAAVAHAGSGKSPVVTYVALGDSYAAGQGAGHYDNACLQSDASYPEQLDSVKHVKLIADGSCSGATTTDVLSQLSVIRKNTDVDLVTLTVGGNDLGVGAITAACSASFTSVECQTALNAAYALLTPATPGAPSDLAVRLAATYAAVGEAAPDATILVTGYPYLFETPPASHPDYATVVALNSATATLNATIQGVVAQLAMTGVDIRYVDVTAAFAGHGIGSPYPWFGVAGVEAFHPTAAGYEAYAAALRAAL